MIQYENDESAVKRAIADAVAEIDHGTARTIASWFDEPGHVHAFVTTGAMAADGAWCTDEIMHLIKSGVDAATLKANGAALDALEAYLKEREDNFDLDPVEGWSGMWVRRHVDYPHESGRMPGCNGCYMGPCVCDPETDAPCESGECVQLECPYCDGSCSGGQ